MSDKRIAIIDLGTNTFHLLIAEKGNEVNTVLHQERIAAKMGAGGINDGLITNEAIIRSINALKIFSRVLETWQVKTVRAFGTSALRSAKNSVELIEKIYLETGIRVKIISGDEEAELIYLGVRTAVPLGQAKSLIVDIGGGSVEFIIANADELFWKKSIEIGGQRLIEKFQRHDPLTKDEREHIDRYLEVQLIPLLDQLAKHQPATLVGSSGSFDTLSEIYCHKQGIPFPKEPETPLTIAGFEMIFDELLQKTRSERLAIPGMIEMRVDMMWSLAASFNFCYENMVFTRSEYLPIR